jgi:hypothetical protein
VGVDLVRKLLKKLSRAKAVECLGRGRSAAWRKTAKWVEP